MDTPFINMLSEEQLKELLAIRTQMAALQARYDQIIRLGSPSSPAMPAPHAAQPAAPSPVPQSQPASAAVPAPAMTPVATPIQPALPAPALSTPAAPRPVAAAPVRPQPVNAAQVPAPRAATPYAAAAAAAPKADEPERITVDGSITSNVRQTLITILTESARPLPFDKIYSLLEATGIQLPSVKPKLVVRKLLYDKALFDVAAGGLFAIKADAPAPMTASQTPAATPVPEAPQPIAVAPAPVTVPVSPAPAIIGTRKPGDLTGAPRIASSFSSKLDAILNQ